MRDSRTILEFRTPSRRCPLKVRNGERVVVVGVGARRKVRRLGNRLVNEYAVCFIDGGELNPLVGWALPDELYPIGGTE